MSQIPATARVRRRPRFGTVTSTLAALLLLAASPALAGGILPGNNPKSNIDPNPNFLQSGSCSWTSSGWTCTNPCVSPHLDFPAYLNQPACSAYVLAAISNARKAEQVDAMVLPTNWFTLSPQEQLFVLADLERTARGLPPYLGLNAALSAEAQQSSATDADPSLAPGFTVGLDAQGYYGMGGTWASGFSTLSADYFWMYDDGWGGSAWKTSNSSCTSANAPACWAHRDELLGYDPKYNPGVGLYCRTCEMGTGFSITHGYSSFVDLIELPAGAPPAMTFTWARNVVPYLPATPAAQNKKVTPRHVNPRRASHSSAWRAWSSPKAVSPLCLALGTKNPWGPIACRSNGTRRSSR